MKHFIRVYTPFILSLFSIINACIFFMYGDKDIENLQYLFSILSGNSITLSIYMYYMSLRMCVWYKLNLLCLFLNQIVNLFYNYLGIDDVLYLYAIIVLNFIGIICFLIFRRCYNVEFVKSKQEDVR